MQISIDIYCAPQLLKNCLFAKPQKTFCSQDWQELAGHYRSWYCRTDVKFIFELNLMKLAKHDKVLYELVYMPRQIFSVLNLDQNEGVHFTTDEIDAHMASKYHIISL